MSFPLHFNLDIQECAAMEGGTVRRLSRADTALAVCIFDIWLELYSNLATQEKDIFFLKPFYHHYENYMNLNVEFKQSKFNKN